MIKFVSDLGTYQGISKGTSIKTQLLDITEIVLKVALSTFTPVYLLSSCYSILNKHYRKPKRQSRMFNSETLESLETQYTGRRQTQHKNTTQNRKQTKQPQALSQRISNSCVLTSFKHVLLRVASV
jgi:hypothetical protein